MVKYIIFIFQFIPFSFLFGQSFLFKEIDSYSILESNDTISLQNSHKLPIIKFNACLFDILNKIVENDSNCDYFIPDKTGYCVSTKLINGGYQIAIVPIYLDKIKIANYACISSFQNRIFLCWGETPKELFDSITIDSIIVWSYRRMEDNYDIYGLGGDSIGETKMLTLQKTKLIFAIRSCSYLQNQRVKKNRKKY